MISTNNRAERRRRLLRLMLYTALVSALALGFIAQRAAAELSERSLSLGRSVENFAGLAGRTTQLSFNGAAFSVSTQVLNDPVDRVLGRFIERCNQDTTLLSGDLAHELHGSASFFQRLLVMRDALAEGTATAACLGGLGKGGLAGLSQRVRAFADSGDVSELGQLRYVYMHGVAQRTHVVLVSAEGPLQLGELFPTDARDVPGLEVVPGVRPENSTLILAAAADGTPHVLNAYRVNAPPAAAMSDYGRKLEALGYQPVWIPSGHGTHFEVSQDTMFARGYTRGTHTVIATSQPESAGGSVLAVAQIERQHLLDAGNHDEHR